MPETFPPYANLIARGTVLLAGVLLVLGASAWYGFGRSSYITRVGLVREQPVPFSHQHHVDGLGLDCRYCHTSVEDSSFAGVPPTATCMNCHTQIWSDSPLLAPVRQSYATGEPLRWVRVHDMPDFVYFNHKIHIAKGVGCTTCHGRVDRQPLTKKTATMFMQWCLDCHRDPAAKLRPRDQVFNVAYEPPADQQALGERLVKQYHVRTEGMTDCVTCHR